MGQQQLILLVLATVIVGIAIVVGIAAFTENSAKSNADAMMQDAVRIANDAQAWKKKPAPFGGQASEAAAVTAGAPADPTDFTAATLPLLGYSVDANGTYENLNGQFRIVVASGTATITGINPVENNKVSVVLDGMTQDDIDGTIVCLGAEDPTGGTATCNPVAF